MSDLLFEKRPDGVALITFNRPESMNALGGDTIALLSDTLQECAEDDAVRCVALTGTGRAFCAGADVKGMAQGVSNAAPRDGSFGVANIQALQNATTGRIYNMPKPTVALVNGVAAGGGFAFALACDVRLAAQSARFGTAYARIGLSSDFGTAFLLERVAPAYAHELLYTAEVIDSARAAQAGIANRVIPDDSFMEEGLAFCARLAAGPTLALRRIKLNLQKARVSTFQEAMDYEGAHFIESRTTEDHREGALAFVEKRQPQFRGG